MSWDARLLERHLTTRRFGRELMWFENVGSTNAWLLENAEQFPMSGTVVVADHQTQGRGRWDRTWHDIPGASLLCSVLLRHPPDRGVMGWLALTPAVALAEVVRRRVGNVHRVSLKWPNDVRLDDRKFAGILGQSSVQGSLSTSVIGVGVNVFTPPGEFPADLRDQATSILSGAAFLFEREVLLAEVLNAWEPLYDDLLSGRFHELNKRWLSLGPELGTRLTRHEGATRLQGSFDGLGARGQLLLRDNQGIVHEIFSGDLSP